MAKRIAENWAVRNQEGKTGLGASRWILAQTESPHTIRVSTIPRWGYRLAVESINCDCGSKVPIPENPSAGETVTTPCLKCKTWWVFHYDADGRFQNFFSEGR
jgi:hypothetical protein